MRFGRRPEDAEAAEIEIEQIGRGIDAAQCPVELEVVADKALLETTREDNLEDVSTQAVVDAPADVCLVLFVGQRGGGFADGAEVVDGIVAVVDGFLHFVQSACFAGGKHFEQHHLVLEVIEDDEVFI